MKLFLTILLISATWSHAESLANLKIRINNNLTNLFPVLIERQDVYIGTNGHYWQGLISHDPVPSHTDVTVGDIPANELSTHPTDQITSWLDLFPEFNGQNFASGATIDVYDGPSGKGWSLTVSVRHGGTIYQRKKNFGPDTSTDFDWRPYVEADSRKVE